jgi:multiple sugar transport system substrate-binding protein
VAARRPADGGARRPSCPNRRGWSPDPRATAAAAKPAEPTKPAAAPAPTTAPAVATKPAAAKKADQIKYQMRASPVEDFVRKKYGPDFEKETGTKVVIEDIPNNEYFQKIVVLAAANQLGDLIFGFTYPWLPSWAAKNLLKPIDEVAIDGDSASSYADYEGCRFEGKLYALPTVAHPSSVNLYFNKTALKAAGATLPDATSPNDSWKHDDLLASALKVTGKGTKWGYMHATDFILYTIANLRSFGAELHDATKALVGSAEGAKAYQYYQDLIYKHKVAPSPAELGQGVDQSSLFVNGELAMFTSATSQITTFPGQIKDKFEWGVFPMPPGPAGSRGATVFGNTTSLTQQSKEPAAAFDLLKYIVRQEVGVEKLLMGSGSPGARPDVFQDKRIVEKYPWYAVGHKVMLEAKAPPLPSNAKTAELQALTPQIESEIWLNKVNGEAGAKKMADAINEIPTAPLDGRRMGRARVRAATWWGEARVLSSPAPRDGPSASVLSPQSSRVRAACDAARRSRATSTCCRGRSASWRWWLGRRSSRSA